MHGRPEDSDFRVLRTDIRHFGETPEQKRPNRRRMSAVFASTLRPSNMLISMIVYRSVWPGGYTSASTTQEWVTPEISRAMGERERRKPKILT